jgi:hypothetical protein
MKSGGKKIKQKKIECKKFCVFGETKGEVAEILGYVATTDMSFEIIGVKEFSGVLGEETLKSDYKVEKVSDY